MENLVEFVTSNADKAHWFIFFGLLLAGLNLPVSIDLVMVISAILAASFVPENKYLIFTSVLFGCIFSAWIAYFLGRFLGDRLVKLPFFAKLLSTQRVNKLKKFYQKYGVLTFIVGRFIPFGVRNCIFMTSGISKMPFKTFALRDVLACTIWATTSFSLFYLLGQNFETIWNSVKTFNIIIFSAFSVTVIILIWYKLKKKSKLTLQ
ncbi:MAG: DedA family protein [Chlamydiae bacterium]|nr:DedA family protein [Chlamydiota bacterium]